MAYGEGGSINIKAYWGPAAPSLRAWTYEENNRVSAGASPLSILLASSEVVGFAKTGGLADVCGYLPRALAEQGHKVAVIMPLYRCVRNGPLAPQPLEVWLPIPLGSQIIPARLWRSKLPGCDVPIFFIEHRDFFERDDPSHGRSLYQASQADGTKKDYPDNAARFILFSCPYLKRSRTLGFRSTFSTPTTGRPG